MLEYYRIGMGFIKDIVSTILGQDEQSNNQNQPNDNQNQASDSQLLAELRHEQSTSTNDEPITKTNLQECYEETIIEREIIKCQRLHGRLLPSTSRKLRKRFGKENTFNFSYHCPMVDRVINRYAKQRQRNNCPIKAQIKEEERKPKAIIDYYIEKQDERRGL